MKKRKIVNTPAPWMWVGMGDEIGLALVARGDRVILETKSIEVKV